MRRNPSAEAGRSETTAELIARITAERDAPVDSTGRHAVLTAPPQAPARTRTAAEPTVRRPRRPAADRALSSPTDPRMRRYAPAVDDEPSMLRTGPIDLTPPGGAAARGRRSGVVDVPRPRRARAPSRAVSEDVLVDPAADETPTQVLGFVAPDSPRPRRTARMLLSVGLVAVAMVLVGVAAAGWFAGPSDQLTAGNAPLSGIGVVPEPAPTGPTVPAPVNGPPAGAVPEPEPATVPDPAEDVRPTGGDEPPSDGYGY